MFLGCLEFVLDAFGVRFGLGSDVWIQQLGNASSRDLSMSKQDSVKLGVCSKKCFLKPLQVQNRDATCHQMSDFAKPF